MKVWLKKNESESGFFCEYEGNKQDIIPIKQHNAAINSERRIPNLLTKPVDIKLLTETKKYKNDRLYNPRLPNPAYFIKVPDRLEDELNAENNSKNAIDINIKFPKFSFLLIVYIKYIFYFYLQIINQK